MAKYMPLYKSQDYKQIVYRILVILIFLLKEPIYKKGNKRFSLESPSKNLVDLLTNSSNIESFTYPEVVQDNI